MPIIETAFPQRLGYANHRKLTGATLVTNSGAVLPLGEVITVDGRKHNVVQYVRRSDQPVTHTGRINGQWQFNLHGMNFIFQDHKGTSVQSLAKATRLFQVLYGQSLAIIKAAFKAHTARETPYKNIHTGISGIDAVTYGPDFQTVRLQLRVKVNEQQPIAATSFSFDYQNAVAAQACLSLLNTIKENVPTDKLMSKAEFKKLSALVKAGHIKGNPVRLPIHMMDEIKANRLERKKMADGTGHIDPYTGAFRRSY